ncbi:MAG: hypothetical protein ACRDHI_01755 [Actinomycetota bacterium]
MGRVVGWLLAPIGSVVFVLGAFLTWSTWDAVSWGFDSFSAVAATAAGLGVVATVVGLGLLQGRPRFLCVATAIVGMAVVVLAADLFARDAGGSLLGELDGWQGSDADGISSLAPVWALLVEGLLLSVVGVALFSRRVVGDVRVKRIAA